MKKKMKLYLEDIGSCSFIVIDFRSGGLTLNVHDSRRWAGGHVAEHIKLVFSTFSIRINSVGTRRRFSLQKYIKTRQLHTSTNICKRQENT